MLSEHCTKKKSMKKNLWIPAVLLAGVFAFTACSKDDDSSESFSSLTPEQHKENLEKEGVAFVQNMNGMADLGLFNVIDEFITLNDQTPAMQAHQFVSLGLTQIEAVKDAPQVSVQLKQLKAEGDESISSLWGEGTGIYEWDASNSVWTKTAADDQITFKFDIEGSAAVISATNFSYQKASHQTEDGFVIELPKSLNFVISLDGTNLCTYAYTGQWYENDTPQLLQEEFYLEGYTSTATLDLQNQSHLKTSSSLKYNESVIYQSGFELQGDVDYNSIMDQMDQMDNEDDLYDQTVIKNANAYFQLGNIKMDGLINAEKLVSDLKSLDASGIKTEKEGWQMMADIFNNNAKLYVRYADSNEIIAKAEVYVTEDYDSYYDYTDYDLDVRMLFADGSAVSGDFFDSGFGDMITEINKLISDMNENYDMGMDPVE